MTLVDEDLGRWYRVVHRILGGKCRFDGARDVEVEREHMRTGKSKIKNPYNSKHVIGPKRKKAQAVDIYPTGKDITSKMLDEPATYDGIRAAAKLATEETGVKVFNGGERWGWDHPHFQLEDAK